MQRQANLKHRYDITLEDFDALILAQGGLCAIPRCERPATDVDHDHSKRMGDPGLVRGLLCGPHNTSLGSFNDDPAYMLEAIAYLRGELKERPPAGGPESPTVKLD